MNHPPLKFFSLYFYVYLKIVSLHKEAKLKKKVMQVVVEIIQYWQLRYKRIETEIVSLCKETYREINFLSNSANKAESLSARSVMRYA